MCFSAIIYFAQNPERRAEASPCSQQNLPGALLASPRFEVKDDKPAHLELISFSLFPQLAESALLCVSADLWMVCKGLEAEMLKNARFCLGPTKRARAVCVVCQVLRWRPHLDILWRRRVQLGLSAHDGHQLRVQRDCR